MTQIGEGIAVTVIAPNANNEENLFKCEWKQCLTNHINKPDYPNDGDTNRNGTYETDWIKAGLEPWELYGPGKDSKAILTDYRNETPSAQYAVSAAALKHPKYHTQKHHLISVNLFDNVSILSHNAKLAGYNVNHKNNGICLPSYVIDIIQHNLQCHRGSHPKALYNDKIDPLLTNLEQKCIKYCEMDIDGNLEKQKKLIDDLNRLSNRIQQKLKSWEWLVRKNALAEREESYKRYENLA